MVTETRLVWGKQLFFVRHERSSSTIQLRRVAVDVEKKTVELAVDVWTTPVSIGAEGFLPEHADLIDVKEVEDDTLGIRYPLLVFHAKTQRSIAANSTSVISGRKTLKRRRSNALLGYTHRLFFFVLRRYSNSDIQLQFLNDLTFNNEDEKNIDDVLHRVLVVDGPYVLVFQTSKQELTVLKLIRDENRIDVVQSGVKLPCDYPIEQVVSCEYINELTSVCPHLLVHVTTKPKEKKHMWFIIRVPHDSAQPITAETCVYLPHFTPSNSVDAHEEEQITCCHLLSPEHEWSAYLSMSANPVAFSSAWPQQNPAQPSRQRVDLTPSTLLVVGTTAKTLYVYENSILLLSFVLPAAPCQVRAVGPSVGRTQTLAVKCMNDTESFYLVSFDTKIQHPCMEILQAFDHVGEALVGEFTGESMLATDQVLLVNKDPGDEHDNNHQIIKRSVIILKKHGSMEKYSCYRLRLKTENKKQRGRGQKRSRESKQQDENGGDASFQCIERIKYPSNEKRDDSKLEPEEREKEHLASQNQLLVLVKSLEKRLQNGIAERNRVALIVRDKTAMVERLNQLVMKQWWKSVRQSARLSYGYSLAVMSTAEWQQHATFLAGSEIKMHTMVGSIAHNEKNQDPDSCEYLQLNPQGVLQDFRPVEYVPSSSLFRFEALLKNSSLQMLRDVFIVLICSPHTPLASGWKCSSSVVAEFHPSNVQESMCFTLELQMPPEFGLLRRNRSVDATVWMHWKASMPSQTDTETNTDDVSAILSASRFVEMSFAIGSVQISPSDFINIAAERPSKQAMIEREQEQLLFLSSGTNLASSLPKLARQSGYSLKLHSIRPTYTLASLAVGEPEMALHCTSSLMSALPVDVYTMVNPLQIDHLQNLKQLLLLLRLELVQVQRNSHRIQTDEHNTENKEDKEQTASNSSIKSSVALFQETQLRTDALMLQMLVALQHRANHHCLWYGLIHK